MKLHLFSLMAVIIFSVGMGALIPNVDGFWQTVMWIIISTGGNMTIVAIGGGFKDGN